MDKIPWKLSLKNKKLVYGYFFVSPFLIGFLLFFLYPLIQSLIFSLSDLRISSEGFNLTFIGLENFQTALLVNPEFNRVLTEVTLRTLMNIPAVIIFSFFAATLINQKFKGRLLARIIFFLPVILTAGVIIRMEQVDVMHQAMLGSEGSGVLVSATVQNILVQLRLPAWFTGYIINIMDQVPEIINFSGIPILIFLAGLQSIPSSLYEASNIEGATAWENFWKITFPLLSPLFMTNIIYIIVDSFTSPYNPMLAFIQDMTWSGGGYGLSAAMSWLYFITIIIILGITAGIISKRVFYME